MLANTELPADPRPELKWRAVVASKHGPHSPVTRHVLLTLGIHLDGLGEGRYPSLALLAVETGLALRTVKQHVAIAAAVGWLRKRRRRLPNSRGWRQVEYLPTVPAAIKAMFHAEQRGARHGSERADAMVTSVEPR